jgi:hypothetical protein
MSTADPFEAAVALSLSGPETDPTMRQEALVFLQSLSTDRDGWRYCLDRLACKTFSAACGAPTGAARGVPPGPDRPEVSFVCLQLLTESIQRGWGALGPVERDEIRAALAAWACGDAGTSAGGGGGSEGQGGGGGGGDASVAAAAGVGGGRGGSGTACSGAARLVAAGTGYLVNKFTSLFALVVAASYPEEWSGVFNELLPSLRHGGAAQAEVFLRIMEAIDREIVSPTVHREQGEYVHGIEIKDAMRVTCVADLTVAWRGIIVAYADSHPSVAALALDTVGTFVDWIDINLIANDSYVPLFYRTLSSAELRNQTAMCLVKMVEKGAPLAQRVALIGHLGLPALITEVTHKAIRDEDDDEDFLSAIAQLLSSTCLVLLEAVQEGVAAAKAAAAGGDGNRAGSAGGAAGGSSSAARVGNPASLSATPGSSSNAGLSGAHHSLKSGGKAGGQSSSSSGSSASLLSSTAGGGGGGGAAAGSSSSSSSFNPPLLHDGIDPDAAREAERVMRELLPMLFAYAGNDDDDVTRATFPALSAYGSYLGKRPAASLSGGENELVRMMCKVAYEKCKYDPSYNHAKPEADEEEFIEFRSDLTVIFRAYLRAAPQIVKTFLAELVPGCVAAAGQAPYRDIEAALHLLHAFPDAAPEHALDPNDAQMTSVMGILVNSGLAAHPHTVVASRFLAVLHRYVQHLYADQTLLLGLLEILLGTNGIHHRAEMIR